MLVLKSTHHKNEGGIIITEQRLTDGLMDGRKNVHARIKKVLSEGSNFDNVFFSLVD